ncbi:MAG TPA: TIGR02266 family protein [Polyangiaceae bacterium]|nr:TIGR02266 family protein [Polyangiaceae bacterium]
MSDEQEKPSDPPVSESPPVSDRRIYERIDVEWSVDCETEQTFLYASITNISEMGIFVATHEPLEVGTRLTLRFAMPGEQSPFILLGQVQWVNPIRMLSDNPNPGMGIRFVDLSSENRERIISSVRTIAYVRDNTN